MSFNIANPSGRAVWDVGLRSPPLEDYGFESRRGHKCLSWVLYVVQVEVSASERSPTECVCVCLCVWVWSWRLDSGEDLAQEKCWTSKKKKIQSAYHFYDIEISIQSFEVSKLHVV